MLFTKSIQVWILRARYLQTSVTVKVQADTLENAKLKAASQLERSEGGSHLLGLEHIDTRRENVVVRI